MKTTRNQNIGESTEAQALSRIENILRRKPGLKALKNTSGANGLFLAAGFEIASDTLSNPIILQVQVVEGKPSALHLNCRIGRSFASLNSTKLCHDINREIAFGRITTLGNPEVFFYQASHLFIGAGPNEQLVNVLIDEAISAQVTTLVALARIRKIAEEDEEAGDLLGSDTLNPALN